MNIIQSNKEESDEEEDISLLKRNETLEERKSPMIETVDELSPSENKERSKSINSTNSLSNSASAITGFIQTARNRLSASGKDLSDAVSGLIRASPIPNTEPSTQD